MKRTDKASRTATPSAKDVDRLQREIHALGDFSHVTVHSSRGHLVICGDDDEPIARLTPLATSRYGMSFHRHTGHWEPMPFVGDLTEQARNLTSALGPYLHRYDFPDSKSGSDH